MDRHRPPSFGLFELDSSRTVEVVLHPLRLTAASRPLHFEYSASALLSITLFASVVSILPRRRKAPPDPVYY
uniref:Uncharacterized protein n=1 Tax=Heterorhabditis bacteriophora TaxID=37862 RepID=A0A1I7WP49_HETBA